MEQLENKILLDKYFDGNTSTEEEKKLKLYLDSYSGKDADLLEAKQIFEILHEDGDETINIDFESIIHQKPNIKLKWVYGVLSGIAASFIIGLSLTFLLKTNNPPVVYAYINGKPITDKEIAIKESKQALLTITTNLNKGTESLNYLNKLNKPVELLTIKTK